MELSELLSKCKVFTAEQSSVDAIERQPAVCGFYDLLCFDPATLPDDTVVDENWKQAEATWPKA